MHKIYLLVIVFTSSLSLNAQYQGYKPLSNLQDFKQNFSAASQKINSIKSDFVQEKNLSMLAEKIVSKGKFWYKKNNLVRMEYTQPFSYLMIINNDNIYLKDDQKANTVSTRSNKLFQQINNLMVDCIKGNVLNNTDFNVRVFENNQSYLIELSPANKALKKMFKTISVTTNKKDYTVTSIDMHELSGDNTVITFINKELNVNISDALFSFH